MGNDLLEACLRISLSPPLSDKLVFATVNKFFNFKITDDQGTRIKERIIKVLENPNAPMGDEPTALQLECGATNVGNALSQHSE
eukprot:gene20764-1122_t